MWFEIKAASGNHPQTIVFDLDSTITYPSPDFETIGDPNPEMIARVRRAKAAGIKVVIQSCRWSVHELNTPETAAAQMRVAEVWLAENDVPYDELKADKVLSEMYVDDHACRADDFQRLDYLIEDTANAGKSLHGRPVSGTYLMTPCPDDLVEYMKVWGESFIPEGSLYVKEDDNPLERFGREAHPHATLAFNLPMKDALGDLEIFLRRFRPGTMEVKLGKVTKFRPEKQEYDVVVIELESPDLVALNALLDEYYEIDQTFTYKPHLTLAYVRKGECEHLDGDKFFKGQVYQFPTIVCKRCGTEGDIFTHAPEFPVEAGIKASKSGNINFWVTPENRIERIEGDDTHLRSLEKIMPKEYQIQLKRWTGRTGIISWARVEKEIWEDALSSGFVRGKIRGEELILSHRSEDRIVQALEVVCREGWGYVEKLIVGFGPKRSIEVPVLEGEDVAKAWAHRKDIRHRVRARS